MLRGIEPVIMKMTNAILTEKYGPVKKAGPYCKYFYNFVFSMVSDFLRSKTK